MKTRLTIHARLRAGRCIECGIMARLGRPFTWPIPPHPYARHRAARLSDRAELDEARVEVRKEARRAVHDVWSKYTARMGDNESTGWPCPCKCGE